jgi:hypothetical protein
MASRDGGRDFYSRHGKAQDMGQPTYCSLQGTPFWRDTGVPVACPDARRLRPLNGLGIAGRASPLAALVHCDRDERRDKRRLGMAACVCFIAVSLSLVGWPSSFVTLEERTWEFPTV